jgi:hypothetical protein
MQVFDSQGGPLPLEAEITTNIVGGMLRVFVTGTFKLASVSPAEMYIAGVIVNIDGNYAGKAQMWVDDASVRHFVANQFEIDSPKPGKHKISIEPFKETPSTQWDLYSLVIEEFETE